MAVFKCKMCGGDLNVAEGMKIVECEYCGTTQTVPNADSEKKTTLFNRANRLRLNSEFDKAAGIYESIIVDFPEEAEAYWGVLLCKYGIEYVDDPATGKKIPTCHRSSFESVMEDENFEQACENTDASARRVYRSEAKRIEEIRKGIIEVSAKEEPYDIFICYKETDDSGSRTVDSAIAQDVYDALTEKGYHVFFARISLEDKLGQEYEPYIFAALNSAKIMLVFGTDYEYFNAVWVKNEWSRYLQLIAAGQKKTLIPCYKDIDAYDMPKEFAKLQSQDMGKVGAMQDLVRGVQKILPKNAPVQSAVPTQPAAPAAAAVAPLLKRAILFLEDGDWSSADEYAERVLDIDPENGEAYLAKAMAELQVKTRGELNSAFGFEENANTRKAIRFGSDALKKEINGYIEALRAVEKTRREEEAARLAAEKAAEQKRRKEEEARIAAEEEKAQKEAVKVIASIHAAIAAANGETPDQRLAREKEKIAALEKLCLNFDSAQERLGAQRETLHRLQLQASELRSQREKLGLFSGKEKQRIDGELAQLAPQIDRARAAVGLLTEKMFGCETKQQAEQALTHARKATERIRRELAAEIYTPEQARTILKQNERIRQLALEEYPALRLPFDIQSGAKTVCFGQYPQTAKKELAPIEWLVLRLEKGRALLLSKYALACRPYHAEWSTVTWETCSLRKWLNDDFYNKAFSEDEKRIIQRAPVTADQKSLHNFLTENDLRDKVVLLSEKEANESFDSTNARKCIQTPYAFKQRANPNADYKKATCWWWLRSPGIGSRGAAYVNRDGFINSGSDNVGNRYGGVRPAVWIDLDA